MQHRDSMKAFFQRLPNDDADQALLQFAHVAMSAKLQAKADEGRGGWHGNDCDTVQLHKLLGANLLRGDMVDVMILAGMIQARSELYGEKILDVMPADIQQIEGARFTQLGANGKTTFAGETAVTIDHSTGLMWGPTLGRYDHTAAGKLCSDLQLLGFKDWRLPTRSELLSITSDTEVKPCVPKGQFTDTEQDWYWTSTAVPGGEGFFRVVSFLSGFVLNDHRSYDGFVRPVRVAASPAGQ